LGHQLKFEHEIIGDSPKEHEMVIFLFCLLQTSNGAEPSAADTAGCPDSSEVIVNATYIEGQGCVVEDITAYCERVYGGVCPTWTDVQAIYGADAERLLTCEDGGAVANRNVYDATSWYMQEDYDNTGLLIGSLTYSYGDTNDSYCCEGVTSGVLRWGDSDGECTSVELKDTGGADTAAPTDTGDTSGAGPCGCIADKGAAAAALLTALTLSAMRRRRRQPPTNTTPSRPTS
jgi:hypothetical protein